MQSDARERADQESRDAAEDKEIFDKIAIDAEVSFKGASGVLQQGFTVSKKHPENNTIEVVAPHAEDAAFTHGTIVAAGSIVDVINPEK